MYPNRKPYPAAPQQRSYALSPPLTADGAGWLPAGSTYMVADLGAWDQAVVCWPEGMEPGAAAQLLRVDKLTRQKLSAREMTPTGGSWSCVGWTVMPGASGGDPMAPMTWVLTQAVPSYL